MSAKLSRSWSFFSGRRPQNRDYLNQDYQPTGTPTSRVNLQQRFNQSLEPRGWRQGPLPPPPPPPPTHHGDTPDSPTGPQNAWQTTYTQAEGHHSLYIHPDEDPYPTPPPSDLPQGHPHFSRNATRGRSPSRSQRTSPAASRLPRRPLRRLPSGVAPLWNHFQDNWSHLKPSTSRVFGEGGRKVNRALQGIRTSFSSLTQMFRSSTRRRYKLDGGTPTPHTPGGHTPRRTPGKLYSPFNMSTPVTPYSHRAPKRLQQSSGPRRNIYGNENRGMVRTPQHCPPQPPPHSPHPSQKHHTFPRPHPDQQRPWPQFDSPSRQLQQDVRCVRQGMRDLEQVSTSILHQPGHNTWTQFR